jgi:hypothetical protein
LPLSSSSVVASLLLWLRSFTRHQCVLFRMQRIKNNKECRSLPHQGR